MLNRAVRTGRMGAALAFSILVVTAKCLGADELRVERLPSNEDLRHFGSMEDPQLSPDGRWVLLQVKDAAADGGRGHLWLVATDGMPPRQLTYSPDADSYGERRGRWMPNGRSILFLARRSAHTELYRLPMDGGEAQALQIDVPSRSRVVAKGAPEIALEEAAVSVSLPAPAAPDIESYWISPGGTLIALVARDRQTSREGQKDSGNSDELWVDHDPHGARLYVFDPLAATAREVPVPPNVLDVAWNGDSKRLAVICEAANGASDLGAARSVWLVDLDNLQAPERALGLPTTIESLTWSANGKSIFFLAQAEHPAPPGYLDLYIYQLDTQVIRNLSDGIYGSLQVGQRPTATADGGVVQLMVRGLDVNPGRWRASGAGPEFPYSPQASISAVSTNFTKTHWAFLGGSSGRPQALFYAGELGVAPRQLLTPAVVPDNVRSIAAEHIQWKSEGLTVDGLLYLPPGASRASRVPLVVDVHGGPTGAYTDEYDQFVDFLLGRGWAVLRPNPRGSIGRGASFAAANKGDLGGGDYRDIMAGVDFVLHSAPLNPNRLALIGYSYGGEMAAFIEAKSTRFKAIVSGAPVVDQISEYGTEAPSSWYDRWFLGKPWESISDAWRQSPLSGSANAHTPLLLLHGGRDEDDPPGQSYEMYRALRQQGVAVDLVIYPRADHGQLLAAIEGKPSPERWYGFDARQRIVEFIQHAFGSTR